MMKSKSVDGIQLIYDADEEQSAGLFAAACSKSIQVIRELWGLETPRDCRVYIMTSWLKFVFHSAAWPEKILLVIVLPLLYIRFSRMWPVAAGWTVRVRRRPVVGVKPPALLDKADTRLGAKIYIKEPVSERKAQNALCHELVHAFSGHLRLPLWLNEGLAMYSVDRYLGSPTVQAETIDILERFTSKTKPATYRNLMRKGTEGIVYNYVRGYWIVRCLDERQPGLIKNLLGKRQSEKAIEKQVSLGLDLQPERLWQDIDGVVVAHFAHLG